MYLYDTLVYKIIELLMLAFLGCFRLCCYSGLILYIPKFLMMVQMAKTFVISLSNTSGVNGVMFCLLHNLVFSNNPFLLLIDIYTKTGEQSVTTHSVNNVCH